jgi:hypothetical protein
MAMFDFFDHLYHRSMEGEDIGIFRIETRDVMKHPAVHITSPTENNCFTKYVNVIT